MFIDTHLDQSINKVLWEAYKADQEVENYHKGKLSASQLGLPVQWQVLKALGVPEKRFDDYTLRKFLRGRQVEDWLTPLIPGLVSSQEKVSYGGAIGLIDAMVDTKDYNTNFGVIPFEVKSVSNAAFKWIAKDKAKHHHILQACFYAMAQGKQHFGIVYVAADDLRIITFIYETKDYQKDVIDSIMAFKDAVKAKSIPKFIPKESWHGNALYQKYPNWADLTEKETNMALQVHYPELSWEGISI